jgi:hypothetical protein
MSGVECEHSGRRPPGPPARLPTSHAPPRRGRYRLHLAQEQALTPTAPARTLYVIEKVRRTARTSTSDAGAEPVRLYHVLDGVAYEVPSLQAVLRARLVRLSWLLGSAFRAVQEVTAPGTGAAAKATAGVGAGCGGAGRGGGQSAAAAPAACASAASAGADCAAESSAGRPRTKRARDP